MLTVTLSPETENRLNTLASQTHIDQSFYVERALEEFLDKYEDAFRILSIEEHIDRGEEKTYSLEDVKRIYDEEHKETLDH